MTDEEKTKAQLLSEVATLRRQVTALENQIAVQARERALFTQLAAIVESSDDAIIGITLDGIILSWNAGAARLYGYAAEEVVGQPIALLIPSDQPHELP